MRRWDDHTHPQSELWKGETDNAVYLILGVMYRICVYGNI